MKWQPAQLLVYKVGPSVGAGGGAAADAEHQRPVIIRTPIIPGINDDEDNIRGLGELVSTLPMVQHLDLLPYHRIGGDKHTQLGRLNPMPPTTPPTDEQMAALKQTLETYGLHVEVGG